MATQNNTALEALLTEHEVGELLKVSVATIRRRRLFRQHPAWVKLGSSVRYKPDAIRPMIETGESVTEDVFTRKGEAQQA